MEIFLIRLLQFMLAISILVLLHEGGHFFFARLFGVRVEKFYLFFDPWFHLFEFKSKKSGTAYGMGWLPLGGYCKISGMVDESFDTEQMAKPAQPWEFRVKPAWQRLLIMLGGVIVNFLLALFIYSMVLFHWGDSYVQVKDMTAGMKFNSEAKALGFKDGDILLGTEKGEFKTFDADFFRDLATATRVDLVRQGKRMSLPMPGNLDLLNMLKSSPRFVMIMMPNTIDSVMPNSIAAKAGLKAGDKIVAFAGKPIDSQNDFNFEKERLGDILAAATTPADSAKALNTTISFVHQGDTTPTTATVKLNSDLLFGMVFTNGLAKYKETHVEYGFFESFPAGAAYGVKVLKGYVGDMKYLFSADGAKSLGGFGAIGSLFPPMWDWHMFWLMTAFLSIILAFMNILPIPALDGGHVLFLLYEMITRRKPSEKFMVRAEYAGISILIILMVMANLNDVLRALGYM